MRNSLKIFNDAFKITDVQKFNFASNVKNLKRMLKNVTMKLNAQKFKFSKNIKDFRKMFKNVLLKSNVHVNAFI